eukprot:gene11426-11768_t
MKNRDKLRKQRDRARVRAGQDGAGPDALSEALSLDNQFRQARKAATFHFRQEQRAAIQHDWASFGQHMTAKKWHLFNTWRGKVQERVEPRCTADK